MITDHIARALPAGTVDSHHTFAIHPRPDTPHAKAKPRTMSVLDPGFDISRALLPVRTAMN